jgi:hypothetical protein
VDARGRCGQGLAGVVTLLGSVADERTFELFLERTLAGAGVLSFSFRGLRG